MARPRAAGRCHPARRLHRDGCRSTGGLDLSNGTIYVPLGSSTGGIVFAHLVTLVLESLVGVLGAGAALRIFSEAAQGRHEQAPDALHFALRRYGGLLWLSILLGVATSVAVYVDLRARKERWQPDPYSFEA
jgi:hypothetical protein